MIDTIESGTAIKKDDFSDSGTPVYQVNNIFAFYLSDAKVFTKANNIKYLIKGDIVTGRVGSIGAFAAYLHEKLAAFSDNVLRIKIADEYMERLDFLLLFLNSALAYKQIQRAQKGSLQRVINQTTIRQIAIPLTDQVKEKNLVAQAKQAQKECRFKLDDANKILSGLDIFLLDILGIGALESSESLTYGVKLSELGRSKQIGADYFHPERTKALRGIKSAEAIKKFAKLDDIADFIRYSTTNYSAEDYVGLADIQGQTGEFAESKDEPGTGLAFKFKKGDVLFARLRPYLNKVWLAEYDGVCSTEFHVIRVKEDVDNLLPGYLSAILRSKIVVSQTKHMMTGNTHPRLANEDVVDLLIPIPDAQMQQFIVEELKNRRTSARKLREEAKNEWAAAMARFEAQLLGQEITL